MPGRCAPVLTLWLLCLERPLAPALPARARSFVRCRVAGRRGYARAWSAIERTQAQGYEALPHQRQALTRAGEALDAIRAEGSTDLASPFGRDPELVRKAADGGGNEAVRAMCHEAQVRADPFLRAGRFIEGWHDLQRDRDQLVRDGDLRAAHKVEAKMTGMARRLDRDRVMAAILLGGGHDDRIDVEAVRSAARTDAHTPDHAAGRDAGDREIDR